MRRWRGGGCACRRRLFGRAVRCARGRGLGWLERRIDALGEEVAELVRAVHRLETKESPSTGERPQRPIVLRDASRGRTAAEEEFKRLVGQPTRTDELARIGETHVESLRTAGTWYAASHHITQKYLLHSYADILRTFGRPESVRPTQLGAVFTYPLPVPGTQNRFYVGFTFADGMVMEAEAFCSAFQEGR